MGTSFQGDKISSLKNSKLEAKGKAGLIFRLRDECGAMLMESAVSFILLMSMLMAVMEICMMSYDYSVLTEAAREGIRYASIHGTDNSTSCSGPSSGCDATATNVINDVKAYAATFSGDFANMAVTVSYPDGVSTGASRVLVNISLTYTPVFYRFGYTPSIKAASSGRILY